VLTGDRPDLQMCQVCAHPTIYQLHAYCCFRCCSESRPEVICSDNECPLNETIAIYECCGFVQSFSDDILNECTRNVFSQSFFALYPSPCDTR
jgi:hypothetical protein